MRLTTPPSDLRVLHIGGYRRGENDLVHQALVGLQGVASQVGEVDTDQQPDLLETFGRPDYRGGEAPVWLRTAPLLELVERHDPHLVICHAGGLSPFPDIAARLRRERCLVGIAWSDPGAYGPVTREIAPNFDLFLTNSPACAERYEAAGVPSAVIPPATSPELFHPVDPDPELRAQVLVVATGSAQRARSVRALRERFDVHVYGTGWRAHGVPSRGTLDGARLLAAISSADVVVVPGTTVHGERVVKPEVFAFAAAGGLVVTEYNEDLDPLLDPDAEVVGHTADADLVKKVSMLLGSPELAQGIRDAGRRRVLAEHTWSRVWPRVLELASLRASAPPPSPPSEEQVEDLVWRDSLEALRRYAGRCGNARPPRDQVELGRPVGAWTMHQRRERAAGRLSPDRSAALEALPGWAWDAADTRWWLGFEAVLRFASSTGHARPPVDAVENDLAVGRWVRAQRRARRDGSLGAERVARLEALPGWAWDASGTRWEEQFEALRRFAEDEGHARPPSSARQGSRQVGAWVRIQRRLHADGGLEESHARRLEGLPGWAWDARQARWEECFEALQRFAEREGHARPPNRHRESGVALGAWVRVQRRAHAAGELARAGASRLEALSGWEWDGFFAAWLNRYDALKRFAEREGHARPPAGHVEEGFRLGSWAQSQRRAGKEGALAAERVDLLEALPGWAWDARQAQWEERFEALRKFAEREGHARPHSGEMEGEVRIGPWVRVQRRLRTEGDLPRAAEQRLQSLPGWAWDAEEARWLAGFEALERFAGREGHARPGIEAEQDGVRVGSWVRAQRLYRHHGDLPEWRAERLSALTGWTWRVEHPAWEQPFAVLERFAARRGHTLPPGDHQEDGVALGRWVQAQRQAYLSGRLSSERRDRLEGVPGWVWDAREARWGEPLALLERFVAAQGHSRPPHDHWEDGFPVGDWVRRQRQAHRAGLLSQERSERLEALPGWMWESEPETWLRPFETLEDLAKTEGHARPSPANAGDLAAWVADQQREAAANTLSAQRTRLLASLPGWVWTPDDLSWVESYGALEQFAGREGHARPAPSHSLGPWVREQRRAREQGKLDRLRIRRLEALPGWAWDAEDLRWWAGYERLARFARREGHARPGPDDIFEGVALGAWVARQRQQRRRGDLDPRRLRALEALPGFAWDLRETEWEERFMLLRRFAEREGHADPPLGHHERGVPISYWLNIQRRRRASGRLGPRQCERLESLHRFSWEISRELSSTPA